jgi:hypothetical protein
MFVKNTNNFHLLSHLCRIEYFGQNIYINKLTYPNSYVKEGAQGRERERGDRCYPAYALES